MILKKAEKQRKAQKLEEISKRQENENLHKNKLNIMKIDMAEKQKASLDKLDQHRKTENIEMQIQAKKEYNMLKMLDHDENLQKIRKD